MTKDIMYKTILDYAVKEMQSILNLIDKDSNYHCHGLLEDTLKHIAFMLQLVKENPGD